MKRSISASQTHWYSSTSRCKGTQSSHMLSQLLTVAPSSSPETYDAADLSPKGEVLSYGDMLEEASTPKHNSGFFEKAILKATTQTIGGSTTNEVKVIANGHCHLTDRCRRVKGVWFCFGGWVFTRFVCLSYTKRNHSGGSFSGYGKIG